jgi:UDP-glucuronate 4-epimerase
MRQELHPSRHTDLASIMTDHSILVTGAAGFIGYHIARRLLDDGHAVIGFDNLNAYYDPDLKRARLAQLAPYNRFRFIEGDLANSGDISSAFADGAIRSVVHLAAQAGVRYSRDNPSAYGQANLLGFLNILEACRHATVAHLVYASSSSVYGANTAMPFSVHDGVDHPLSLYAATKKANELMAHSYAHMFGLPSTGLRFFTVYGPWGRPDMAMWLFTDAILNGRPITLFNEGRMKRDFTYIDDIVDAVIRLVPLAPKPDAGWDRARPDPASSFAPHRVFNIGNHQPVALMHLVETLEQALGRKAITTLAPMERGDVEATYADITELAALVGFSPSTSIEEGVPRFVDWFRSYHRL